MAYFSIRERSGVTLIRFKRQWLSSDHCRQHLIADHRAVLNKEGQLAAILIPLRHLPTGKATLRLAEKAPNVKVANGVLECRIRPTQEDFVSVEVELGAVCTFDSRGQLSEIEVF